MPTMLSSGPPLPPRSPKGGRPSLEVAAQLNFHILSTALDMFGRHGVDGATMNVIAAAAHVSKRTLYSRFGTKGELVSRVIEHCFTCHIEPVTAIRPPEGKLGERLLYAAGKLLNASLKPEMRVLDALLVWVGAHEPQLLQIVRQRMVEGPVALFASIFRTSVESGEARLDDLEFAATFTFDALVRTPRNRIMLTGDLDDSARAKRDYLERAIGLILLAARA
ncbi:TetR/AcrR family transcriptional regulator [Sphingobium fuliginis]|uniref:TetR/AcrR family transcriptional regulator n=3 Tax=Sphingobium TaxID=165695 RepID=A0A5B8CBI9_SPHSA|nr:TetR/AcrR family transcriptional regulator [Sphingobium fuliginis]QDC36563.1 TetR/AcrR family transcriptional regulator [Sphingobium fuliginis ATCC 27551]